MQDDRDGLLMKAALVGGNNGVELGLVVEIGRAHV